VFKNEPWPTLSRREPVGTALEADRKTTVEGYEITKAVVTWEMKNEAVHETK
jgi:hypothetical protein